MITFLLLFKISDECFQPLTIFKCLTQAVLMADRGRCKLKQDNQLKASEKHQPRLEEAKEVTVHIKTNKIKIIQQIV